jgi:hypothetical protein
MRYQIIEQSKRGEPWRFVAHGSRYGEAESREAVANAERLGVRRKRIAVGRESKAS